MLVPEPAGAKEDERDPPEEDEAAQDEPEQSPALLAFALFERIAAVTGFLVGPVMRLAVDEVAEAGEDLARVEPDKACVGSDEATNERLGWKIGVVIGFQRMQKPHVDLRRR